MTHLRLLVGATRTAWLPLIPHQPLDFADAAQGGGPHLQLKAALSAALLHGATALGQEGIEVFTALKGVPELALQPGSLDEIPALHPGGQGHDATCFEVPQLCRGEARSGWITLGR